MKQVIEQSAKPTTSPDDATENKFYGIQFFKRGTSIRRTQKGFIMQSDYRKGPFRVMNAGDGMTYGNGYEERLSLIHLIRYYVEKAHAVYEFETAHELFKWLSE